MLKQTASETSTTSDRQFEKLVDAILHGDQRDASYGFSAGVHHEDVAALQENGVCRVVQNLAVFGLKIEILGDPLPAFVGSPIAAFDTSSHASHIASLSA